MEPWTVNSEGFEDSFVTFHQTDQEPVTFEKLPDSESYLKNLEEKLKRLEVRRKPGNSEGHNISEKKQLVESLTRAKKSALDSLINDDIGNTGSIALDLDQTITSNYLTRRLIPEQPLNRGEIVELTKTDILEQEVESLDQDA